jgi:sigma-54 dependent transcriptional regulator, acetoin dehydrogenase operon transcriptional activator AcoR
MPLTLPFVADRTLGPGRLKELTEGNRELLLAAEPVLRESARAISEAGCTVILANERGFALQVTGESPWLEPGPALMEGSDLTQPGLGIEAVRNARLARSPARAGACSAAPIFAPDGSLAGVLGVTAAPDGGGAHTLGLAIAAARAVEERMNLASFAREVRTANLELDAVLEATREATALVDASGRIVKLNGRARQYLTGSRAESPVNLLHLISPKAEIVRTLQSGTTLDEEEVSVSVNGTSARYLCSVRPVRPGESGPVVVTLRPAAETAARPSSSRAKEHRSHFTLDDLIGESPAMRAARKAARHAAQTDVTVLILGESGTGKELLAHGLHNASRRAGGPFVALNCSAIPRTLLESELFGYEAGAFTGAARQGKPGKFELAAGGTLFLDEIADMPLEMQAAVLRVLQDREVVRVGGLRSTWVDVRVIAATNRNLYGEVKAGNFRADLLYRLDVFSVVMPPLREHMGDLPQLVSHILQRHGSAPDRIAPEAVAVLQQHHWPGNVRELENVLERTLSTLEGEMIQPGHVLAALSGAERMGHPYEGVPQTAERIHTMMDVERAAIDDALRACNGNLSQTARRLGISRPTLYRKLGQYGLSAAAARSR